MLLHVADAGILADVEGVHAVVPRLVAAGVVDAAAGHDLHVAVLAHVEVVVDHLGIVALADDDGDIAFFALRAVEDADVDALLAVRAGVDLDVLGALARLAAAVLADVERLLGLADEVGDLFQQGLINLGDHLFSASFLVSTGQEPSVSAMILGNTSSALPR